MGRLYFGGVVTSAEWQFGIWQPKYDDCMKKRRAKG